MTKLEKQGKQWVGIVYSDDGQYIRTTKKCRDRKEALKELKKLENL